MTLTLSQPIGAQGFSGGEIHHVGERLLEYMAEKMRVELAPEIERVQTPNTLNATSLIAVGDSVDLVMQAVGKIDAVDDPVGLE